MPNPATTSSPIHIRHIARRRIDASYPSPTSYNRSLSMLLHLQLLLLPLFILTLTNFAQSSPNTNSYRSWATGKQRFQEQREPSSEEGGKSVAVETGKQKQPHHAPIAPADSTDSIDASVRVEDGSQLRVPEAASSQVAAAAKKPSLDGGSEEKRKRVKGNSVALSVYMEAQCPDTTGFVRRQLMPTWAKLGPTRRIHLHLVPFGKASCERRPQGEIECECQHGPVECQLNALMCCTIDRLRDSPDAYVPLIGCLQGGASLDSAFRACIPTSDPNYQWLWECANSRRGRELLLAAGEETAAIKDFNFVPWVMLDGKRVNDAFYALEENLCRRLDEPRPVECGKYFGSL